MDSFLAITPRETHSVFTRVDSPVLCSWLRKSGDKYLSPQIQNEILKVMSLSILQSIAKNLRTSSVFSVMADECVDTTKPGTTHNVFSLG